MLILEAHRKRVISKALVSAIKHDCATSHPPTDSILPNQFLIHHQCIGPLGREALLGWLRELRLDERTFHCRFGPLWGGLVGCLNHAIILSCAF